MIYKDYSEETCKKCSYEDYSVTDIVCATCFIKGKILNFQPKHDTKSDNPVRHDNDNAKLR